MKTYEFVFSDGTRMLGDGDDLADGLYDAYHRNGYLPVCRLVDKREVAPDDQVDSRRPGAVSPRACDTASHTRPAKPAAKRGPGK